MKICFEYEKETKGAVRYKELSDSPVVGTLYIRKAALKGLGAEAGENIAVIISKEEN